MAQRGRDRGRSTFRGSSRGRGRGRGRGGLATRPRNGFKSSRVEEIDEASSADEQTGEASDTADEVQPEEDQSNTSEDEENRTKQSYASLLQVLNVRKTLGPPRKKRKIEADKTNGTTKVHTTSERGTEMDEKATEAEEVGLAEVIEADEDHDEAIDSDDDEVMLTDPFVTHYAKMEEQALQQAITEQDQKRSQARTTTIVGGTKKVTTTLDGYTVSAVKSLQSTDIHLKQRLVATGADVLRQLTEEEGDLAREVFAYRDIQYGNRTTAGALRLRDLTSLHALNHILKTRDTVIKNNVKLSHQDGHESLEIRDQGFTRPKVLIVVPTKQSCVRYVDSIVKMVNPEQQENRARFLETFSASDDESWENKTDDFRELFGGNHEEDFRIGLKFTRRTIKYFSGFYNSDIIIGSALGLMRTITTGGGAGGKDDKKKTHDADFLSSIELAIVDNASAIQMQNWQHLEYTFSQMNLIPKDSHGCDFSRVRSWYLDNKSKHLRQTIILSAFHTPELNALVSGHTFNIAGRVKYTPSYAGSMLSLPPTIPFSPSQSFLRFDSATPAADPDSRFNYFTTSILPPIIRHNTKGVLIFIPTYHDFVRVRNYLSTSPATTSLSFGTVSEYTPVRDANRARSHFMHARHSVLIYSERAHHHFRYRMRGVRKVVFYGVPENPLFWAEIVGYLGLEADASDDGRQRESRGKGAVRAMFSRWDALKLERIVGTERVGRLINDRGGDTFEFV